MADITVERTHPLEAPEARRAAERAAQKLQEGLGVEYAWEEDVLHLSHPGATGRIEFEPAMIRVLLDVKGMYKPMKGAIRVAIEQFLDQQMQAVRP